MSAPEEDMESSRAPLLDHLIELRSRLIKSIVAIVIGFGICIYFAKDIFNILVAPYNHVIGSQLGAKLIFTAPQEFFLTQMKLAFFGAMFLAFPIIAIQIYMFVAPGLYKNERHAFLPYLVATPILFPMGACLVYFGVLPMALGFFAGMQQQASDGQAAIELLPRVSEYLGLVMTLIFAFGLCFQLPVVLTLLGRVGIVSSDMLRRGRKYALVVTFAAAAFLTPPDLLSQLALGTPTYLLYEVSILLVAMTERKRAAAEADEDEAE